MDSNQLRQMSLQNAQLALQQAQMNIKTHRQYLNQTNWKTLQQRINGGGVNSLKVLTIQNIERIVGSKFMVRGMVNELYSINDYPGRYEYWFWHRPLGVVGRDKKLVLHRVPDFETSGDRYYILENVQHNTTIRIAPTHLKNPKDFIDLLENYLNH